MGRDKDFFYVTCPKKGGMEGKLLDLCKGCDDYPTCEAVKTKH